MAIQTTIGMGLDALYQLTNQLLGVDQRFNPDNQYGGLKPWLDRPGDWTDFSPSNVVNIGAVGTETTILTYEIPDGQDGVITDIVCNYSASDFNNGDLFYRIYVDDRPVKNFEAIRTNLGTFSQPWPVRIRVFSSNRIRVAIYHADNPTLSDKEVTAIIKGYTYNRVMVG